jgi:hypothetical protein
MSNASRWRIHSAQVINEAIRAGKAASECSSDIRKRVDAAYPFGMRQYHPYRIWLSARREAFAFHGLATDAERKRASLAAPKVNRPNRRTTPADIEGAVRDGLIRP